MEDNRREEAIKYIMDQLEDGYIDLGLYDQDELEIIKEAMNMFQFLDYDFDNTCYSTNHTSISTNPYDEKL